MNIGLVAIATSKWSWLGFGLPLGLNAVEGSEAALLAAASAARGGWRRALLATLCASLALIPFAIGLYFLFRHVNGAYLDYGIAALIFLLGANEVREGLSERGEKEKAEEEKKDSRGWTAVWPAFAGVFLEGGEAVLYTFGVAHGSAGWVPAAIGGALGFALPWLMLKWLRAFVDRLPEWKVELAIGLVLMVAASTFGILRASGVFGG